MRSIYLLVLGIFLLASCSNNDSYKIEGKVENVAEGWIFIKKVVENELKSVDSVELKDGKFTFEGKQDSPEMVYVMMAEQRQPLMLFLENAKIELTVNFDSIAGAKVTGSKSHEQYVEFNTKLEPFSKKQEELYNQYMEAQMSQDSAKVAGIIAQYDKLYEEQKVAIKDYIKANTASFVAAYVAKSHLSYELDFGGLDSLLAQFDASIANSSYITDMKSRADVLRKVAVGQPAPDFSLPDTTGTMVSLSSFKGKYLLIDFWAAWCRPCRAENPNVVALYKDYKDKGFEILGVSFDSKKEDWVEAIKVDGITWTQISDLKYWNCEAGKLYGVNSIPHTILLDKEGIIIAKNLRGEELRAKIAELLK